MNGDRFDLNSCFDGVMFSGGAVHLGLLRVQGESQIGAFDHHLLGSRDGETRGFTSDLGYGQQCIRISRDLPRPNLYMLITISPPSTVILLYFTLFK